MYRIRVVPLFIPPLRERTGDAEALAWHFVDDFNERGSRRVELISADVLDAMLAHDWPGNVRELMNVIEYAFAVGDGPELTLDELPPELRGEPPPADPRTSEPDLRDLERDRIVEALRETGGKKAAAARALGMSRSTLWRKMREHRLVG